MGVIGFRCPETGEEVTTAIETSRDTLEKMRSKNLAIWAFCPHCMTGHQIKPADAVIEHDRQPAESLALADS
jgi:hypothetical protein